MGDFYKKVEMCCLWWYVKAEIAKYVSTHAAIVRKLKGKAEQVQSSDFTPTIEYARGWPLLFDHELDLKLRTMIIALQLADTGINIHVVRCVLNGLVPVDPKTFGRYIDFQVTRSWVRSLWSFCRM